MIACKYSIYLSDYLDKQLTANQESKIDEHLPLCTICEKELKQLKQMKLICFNLPEEDMPAGLHERIILHIRRKNKCPDKVPWIKRIAVPMAAVILFLLIGKAITTINGNNSRNMYNALDRENIIMATPEADRASNVIAEEAFDNVNSVAIDEKLSDYITEDSIDYQAEVGSSREENIYNKQSVKLSIGAAILLACIYFFVKVLKLKR